MDDGLDGFFYTDEQIENEQKDIRIRVGGYYAIQFQPDYTGADLILQNNNRHGLTNFKWELVDEKTVKFFYDFHTPINQLVYRNNNELVFEIMTKTLHGEISHRGKLIYK